MRSPTADEFAQERMIRNGLALDVLMWSGYLVLALWTGAITIIAELLGVPVDLLTPGDLPPKFRAQVLAEVQPV